VRSDLNLAPELRGAESWKYAETRFSRFQRQSDPLRREQIRYSFSGHERNKLFLNRQGVEFADVSGVSGLDSPSDGRVFVHWDFDRDGWPDVALVNTNNPQLQVFHNEVPLSAAGAAGGAGEAAEGGGFIALRFVGGNRTGEPTGEWSNRDGYGVKARLSAGALRLLREHRCGEGMAAQNSAWMLIGIGQNRFVDEVSIEWPSGKRRTLSAVPAGTLVTVYEDAAESPDGAGEARRPYASSRSLAWSQPAAVADERLTLRAAVNAPESPGASAARTPKLIVYTTMATSCAACKRHLAQIEYLRARLGGEAVALYGLPMDDEDDREELDAFVAAYRPAYKLLTNLSGEERGAVQASLNRSLPPNAMPAFVVTDGNGRVVRKSMGVPTLSELRQLAAQLGTSVRD
jgi:hypothetical protein